MLGNVSTDATIHKTHYLKALIQTRCLLIINRTWAEKNYQYCLIPVEFCSELQSNLHCLCSQWMTLCPAQCLALCNTWLSVHSFERFTRHYSFHSSCKETMRPSCTCLEVCICDQPMIVTNGPMLTKANQCWWKGSIVSFCEEWLSKLQNDKILEKYRASENLKSCMVYFYYMFIVPYAYLLKLDSSCPYTEKQKKCRLWQKYKLQKLRANFQIFVLIIQFKSKIYLRSKFLILF